MLFRSPSNRNVMADQHYEKSTDKKYHTTANVGIRAGRILMRRPGVVVPEDIKADVRAAPDSSNHPSSSVVPEKDIGK